MTILRRTLNAILAATALVSTVAVSAMAEAEVKLRLHQFLPAQANVPKNVLAKWIADVEARFKRALLKSKCSVPWPWAAPRPPFMTKRLMALPISPGSSLATPLAVSRKRRFLNCPS